MSVYKTNIDEFTGMVGLVRNPADEGVERVELGVDWKVEMRQIRQISQKIGKLWSPVIILTRSKHRLFLCHSIRVWTVNEYQTCMLSFL